jgi:hypothetical protein
MKPTYAYKRSRVSYNINMVCFLHVSTTLVACITNVFQPLLKCTTQSFETYGLKYTLKYKIQNISDTYELITKNLSVFYILIMVYLLPAVGLTPDGSSTVHIYTQTGTQNNIINNFGWKAFWDSNPDWSN